jgi:hypothetical protein
MIFASIIWILLFQDQTIKNFTIILSLGLLIIEANRILSDFCDGGEDVKCFYFLISNQHYNSSR